MKTKILDLDTPIPDKILKAYEAILHADDILPILQKNISIGIWPGYYSNNNIPSDLKDKEKKVFMDVQCECEQVFHKNYTHVIAYHACRTDDPAQYRRNGLLISSRKRLEAFAKEIFMGCSDLDKAIVRAGSRYFGTYEGSLSMHISGKFACTEYLNKGSHYLRLVAVELGLEGNHKLKQFYKETTPYFVKCKMPIGWLEDATVAKGRLDRYQYNASLMRRVICAKIEKHEEYLESSESILIVESISAENIEDIIPPNCCLQWRKENEKI